MQINSPVKSQIWSHIYFQVRDQITALVHVQVQDQVLEQLALRVYLATSLTEVDDQLSQDLAHVIREHI